MHVLNRTIYKQINKMIDSKSGAIHSTDTTPNVPMSVYFLCIFCLSVARGTKQKKTSLWYIYISILRIPWSSLTSNHVSHTHVGVKNELSYALSTFQIWIQNSIRWEHNLATSSRFKQICFVRIEMPFTFAFALIIVKFQLNVLQCCLITQKMLYICFR